MEEREYLHFHFCSGLAGAAKGFNKARAEAMGLTGRLRCIGGIDNDAASVRDFTRETGVKGTLLDLFDREQYTAFHGHEPPPDWREATISDLHAAAGNERPNIVFISAPCKGFSGLLSQKRSETDKYQALNRLTLRCVWLMCEAWGDDPPEFIAFENVPRIITRGSALIDQIRAILVRYGYAVVTPNNYTHDCGEIGGLAQSRKRFLLMARHMEKVPPFLYEPPKRPLRSVGEILGRMPMPGDMRGGPMHRIPNLQWKTWVRLAFVEAGKDWRSLNKLKVVDGTLADYLLVPEGRNDFLGVNDWDRSMGAVTGDARPSKGAFSVADPRFEGRDNQQYGVRKWDEPTGSIINVKSPGQGAFAVADPRHLGNAKFNDRYRVVPFDSASKSVTGASGQGQCVADPRTGFPDSTHQNVYRIVHFEEASKTVTGSDHLSGGALSVADPRPPEGPMFSKYQLADWSGPSGTVISGNDKGAYAIADPRPGWENRYGNLKVNEWDKSAPTVIAGGKGVQGGWLSIADPRIQLHRSDPYGVAEWEGPSAAVIGHASHDNGKFSVADPRLPEANEKLVAVIRALDNTWHRPFTTLELAALQSLVDPEACWSDSPWDLDGSSDSAKRERIGNAVPPLAAQAMGEVMLQTLLLAAAGQTFQLSAAPIWVRPFAIALSVKTQEVSE